MNTQCNIKNSELHAFCNIVWHLIVKKEEITAEVIAYYYSSNVQGPRPTTMLIFLCIKAIDIKTDHKEFIFTLVPNVKAGNTL